MDVLEPFLDPRAIPFSGRAADDRRPTTDDTDAERPNARTPERLNA
jgi:hypothetical protein